MPLRKKYEKITLYDLLDRVKELENDVNIYYNPDNLLGIVFVSDEGMYVDENNQPIRVRRSNSRDFQKTILNTISRENQKQIKLF